VELKNSKYIILGEDLDVNTLYSIAHVSSHTITTSFSRQTVKQQAEEISVDKLNIAIAEKAAYRAGRRGLTTIFCFFFFVFGAIHSCV